MSDFGRSIPYRGVYLDAMAGVELWVDRVLAIHFAGRGGRADLLHAALLARISLAIKLDCLKVVISDTPYAHEYESLASDIKAANDFSHLLAHAPEVEIKQDPAVFLRFTGGKLKVTSIAISDLERRVEVVEDCYKRVQSLHDLLFEDDKVEDG